MAKDNGWSFRWGVPLLDEGFVTIPNLFLRSYARHGISRDQWLFVLHLAAYHFESPQGESRPSLETVAAEMGYKDVRSVQQIKAGLESRGLLRVQYRRGLPSVYDVSPMSRLLLSPPEGVNQDSPLTAQGVNWDSPGGVNQDSPGGVNWDSPKEKKVRTAPKKEKVLSYPIQAEKIAAEDLPQVWQELKDILELELARGQWQSWIRPTKLQKVVPTAQGVVLTISHPTQYGCEALAQGNIRVPLIREVRHLFAGKPRLCFVVDLQYDLVTEGAY